MPYVNPFSSAAPLNSDFVSQGALEIRTLKAAIIERMGTIVFNFDTNPLQFKPQTTWEASLNFLANQGAGTSNAFFKAINLSGQAFFGINGGVGGELLTGTAAYATIVNSFANQPLIFGTNNVVRMTIAAAGAVSIVGNLSAAQITGTDVLAAAGNALGWVGRSRIASSADAIINLLDLAQTSFGRLTLGLATAAFPALKRNGAALDIRLGDDSAFAAVNAGNISVGTITGTTISGTTITGSGVITGTDIVAGAANAHKWTGRSQITSTSDGAIAMLDSAGAVHTLLVFGPAASDSALLTTGGAIAARRRDNTDYVNFTCKNLTVTGTFTLVNPNVRAYRTATLDLAQNTLTAVGFDAEDFDSGTLHDNVTNNSRFVAPVTGKYSITAHISWTGATANTFIVIRKNGVATDLARSDRAVGNTSVESVEVNVILSLAASDYVEVYAQTSSTANPDIQAGIERTYFQMVKDSD